MQPTNPAQMAMQQNGQQPQISPDVVGQAQQQINQRTQDIDQQIQQQEQQNQQTSPATISRAMAMLNPKANMKDGEANTMSKIGQSIASPAYAGYCQKFADDETGSTQRYPTAAATWNAKVESGEAQTDLSKMKPGDVVEFKPDQSNGGLGHAAVVQKDGSLKMATYSGVQTYSLKDWTTHSGQVPEGFYSPN